MFKAKLGEKTFDVSSVSVIRIEEKTGFILEIPKIDVELTNWEAQTFVLKNGRTTVASLRVVIQRIDLRDDGTMILRLLQEA